MRRLGRPLLTTTRAAVALGICWAGQVGSLSAQDVGYSIGRPDAPLTVVEFLDFGCSHCASFAVSTMPYVRSQYVEAGRVRWIAVPFVLGSFPNSDEAARAAACAANQEAFWPMHDLLFEQRGVWLSEDEPFRTFAAQAASLELDGGAFERCYGSSEARDRVEAQTRTAREFGVTATPTFLLGGDRVLGAYPFEDFSAMLEERLPGRER